MIYAPIGGVFGSLRSFLHENQRIEIRVASKWAKARVYGLDPVFRSSGLPVSHPLVVRCLSWLNKLGGMRSKIIIRPIENAAFLLGRLVREGKMGIRKIQTVVLFVLMCGMMPVQAGYWYDSSGGIWRSGAGECWRTGYWTPEMIVAGCDGGVAELVKPEPMAKPAPPAPEPAPAPVAMTSVDATVNFGFDRADLESDATAVVDRLLQSAPSQGRIKSVKLTGHTDRIGTDGYNLDLSLRRASSVADYLVQSGKVDPQVIEIAGKGETEPLVGCEGIFGAAAIECLAPNRRVDMVLDLF